MPNSTLYLKSLSYIDEYNQNQNLNIRPLAPNNPSYIAQEKQKRASSFFWESLTLLLFAVLGYINHIGRYIKNEKTVKKINIAIIIFYVASFLYFIVQYLGA